MITTFIISLSVLSVIASVVALYVLIIGSFEKKEKKEEKLTQQFIKRESRTIKITKSEENPLKENKGLNTQVSSLLWTVVIGQAVALYFILVFLEGNKDVNIVLRVNGIVLLLASFLCSILTIFNGWFKKKMNISHRLMFQVYSLVVAIILFRMGIEKGISIKEAIGAAGYIPNIIIIVYFSTVIFALALMLFDGIYRKSERVDFNFNIYLLIVVAVGMGVGLSLLLALSILLRS